jgi:hypothetical protein
MLIRPPESLAGMGSDYGDIKRKIEASYNANQSIWQVYWNEATLDVALEAGLTDLQAGTNSTFTNNNNRGQFYFNHVRPLGLQLKGYQQKNRKSLVVVPGENGDQETADQWSKLMLNVFKKENVYSQISEAFHQGAFMTGMNLLQVYLDWSEDPVNGDIKVENLAYNRFFIDPYYRDKIYLSDCSFIWKRSYITHSEAAALMPEHYERIMSIPGNPAGAGSRDGRFQWLPEAYGQSQKNVISYDEYYYRDYRPQVLLYDKKTGEKTEYNVEVHPPLDYFLEETADPITGEYTIAVIRQDVPTIRLAIMIQDEVYYDGPSGFDHYPFVPVVGFYNSMMPYFYNRIQGICRSLRDVQAMLNRRINLNADFAESALNTGWIFKEDAVIDVNHLFQTGQGRVIPLKKSAQMTDIMPIPAPQVPPSYFQMQETYLNEFPLVSGITDELMGNADNDKSGYRTRLLQGAGLTTLQPLFSALDDAQNRLGELIMDAAMKNYTPGKVRLLLEGQEPTPFFYRESFGKYHCQVELGYDTESQKQMQFLQLLQLREMGIAIPDQDMISAATIQNKTEILERMQQREQQAQQMQQMQAQMAMQQQQAQIQGMHAKAESDKGWAVERYSRVKENQALAEERRAQAIKDHELAISEHHRDEEASILNFIKAAKELRGIDIDHVRQVLEISRQMSQEREPEYQNERRYA